MMPGLHLKGGVGGYRGASGGYGYRPYSYARLTKGTGINGPGIARKNTRDVSNTERSQLQSTGDIWYKIESDCVRYKSPPDFTRPTIGDLDNLPT
jgi:hypothetical protein